MIYQTKIKKYRLPIISFCVEIGPLITFFIVEAYRDFFIALVALIAATILGLFASIYLTGRPPWFALFGGAFLIVFGGLSIVLQDEDIFIIQDTITNAILSAALLLTAYRRTPLLKLFFETAFAITDRAWKLLNLRWGVMFLLLAIGNEIVRIWFTPEVWVEYRAWSILATIAFGLYQFTLSARERLPGASNAWGLRIKRIK